MNRNLIILTALLIVAAFGTSQVFADGADPILCTTHTVSVALTGSGNTVVASPFGAAQAGAAGVTCYQSAKASCENLKPGANGQANGTIIQLTDQCHRYCGALTGNQAKCTIYNLAANSASATCALAGPSNPSTANLSQAVQNTVTTGGVSGTVGNVKYTVGYNHSGGAASVSCSVTGTATATCECKKANNQTHPGQN